MRLACDHGGDQAYDCSESGDLVQEGPGPKCCLSPD
jgi:hypothetical protein